MSAHRRSAAVSCAVAIALASSRPAPAASTRTASSDPRLASSVDAYLHPLQELQVWSGVVLIARGERVLLHRAYGQANVELGVPNGTGQVFRIASLSKPFTEVALGRLKDRGRLAFDDPLARFLPGFPRADSITVRMLIEHRAGIPSLNSIPWDEEAVVPGDLDSLVRVIASHPLDFPPGSRRRYSNGGYALLARVLEVASGEPYARCIAREVADPLGLAHTRHEEDFMVVPGRAYGYQPSPTERHRLVVAPFQQMSTKSGGGSLVSTADDLHRFLMALHRHPALRPETWAELFPKDSVFFFQGRCPGFNTVAARWFSDDLCVVVLSNNYASGMVADVAEALKDLALGRAAKPFGWRADLPADSASCTSWCGRWRPTQGTLPIGNLPLGVRWEHGELLAAAGTTTFDVLLPQPDGSFLLRGLWSTIRFDPPREGSAATAELRYLWRDAGVKLERERPASAR